jgi:hypothetical protein
MGFGTWNIRSVCKVGSLMTVLKEPKLYLVGVQEVRWEGDCTEPAGEYEYTFSCGKTNENHELGTGSFCA